ncbi:flagellar biosynthesis protein FlhA [Bacillus bombysepticus]|uniref:flagellar biosynthesis protein FlhA n=1 Tax=Bacillus bombysepticus TaxID=658666 RepID=UPI00301841E9
MAARLKEAGWIVVLLSFVMLMFASVPPFVIDLSIVIMFVFSMMVLMRTATMAEWSELKSFPVILVMAAVFRIALNITTTKSILFDGHAGNVVENVGTWMVGSNIWIGFVIFIILTVIQIVIAIGANRMSEVNARFTLESLPAKQMDIMNEMNAGVLTQEEAKEEKKKLQTRSEFYSSMDGAGKYIKGDVMTGILLFVVNIGVGFVVGMMSEGLTASEAARKYTILTIGDGIVTQISTLMISIGAGMVLGRVYGENDNNVLKNIMSELTGNALVLYVAGAVLLFLAMFTNMPFLPFALIGISLCVLGFYVDKRKRENEQEQQEEAEMQEVLQDKQVELKVIGELPPITVEFGMAIAPIVQAHEAAMDEPGALFEATEDNVYERVRLIRRNIAVESGVEIPSVYLVDNVSLGMTGYQIKIKGVVMGKGELKLDQVLALKGNLMIGDEELINGEFTKDPVFGTDAYWIPKEDANDASLNGWIVEDWLSILSTHIRDVVLNNLHMFMDRQQTSDLIEFASESKPVLKKQIDQEKINLSVVQGVFKNLLKETVSIRDLSVILEEVIDSYMKYNDMQLDPFKFHMVDEITLLVRERLASQVCAQLKGNDSKVCAIMFDSNVERSMEKTNRNDGYYLAMEFLYREKMLQALANAVERVVITGVNPVVLVARADIRLALSRALMDKRIKVPVVSMDEVQRGNVDVEVVRTVTPQEIENVEVS